MSDYTKITDYSAKDALLSGDAAKRVKGSEIGADFDAVAVAIATKSDTSFLQVGTGAVATTVHTKLRETVSVKDFGAVGDGVTDDTAAIQAAFDSITGNRPVAVYFPMNDSSKYYRITSTLNVAKPCLIHGDGEYGTAIVGDWTNNAQYILSFDLTAATTYFYTIRDITIYSKNAGAVRGLLLKNTPYVTLENVYFVNCYNGIVVTGTNNYSHDYRRVVTYNSTASGVRFTSFTGGGQFLFDACTFDGNTGWAMESGSTIDSLSFVNCNFEQCVTNSFVMNGTCRGLSFIGCRTEGLNGVNDFIIDPPVAGVVSGLSVIGCAFNSDTAAGVPIKIGGTGGIIRGFNISGNTVANAGLATNFVTLNGEGHAGVVTGNYFEQVNTTPLNTRRAAVVCFANYNSAGVCAENWGSSEWDVQQSTFTLTDRSGAGLAFTGAGVYSLVGRTVFWQYKITFPVTASGANASLTGLPYVVNNLAGQAEGRAGGQVNISDAGIDLGIFQGVGSTISVDFYNSQTAVAVINSALSGKTIYMSGFYTK